MINKKRAKEIIKAHLEVRKDSIKPSEEEYKDFGILNPSIASTNLGDLIIHDSVYKNLIELFPNDMFTSFPTQIISSFDAKLKMSKKELLFVGGTNLLTSNLDKVDQWRVDQSYKKFLNNRVVLFGCGWWQYQEIPNHYTKNIYSKVLNKSVLHSVRDEYSKNQLNSIGIDNVVNTTCPTLWGLNKEKCKLVTEVKSENVVTTLTFYNKSIQDDSMLFKILSKNYNKVFLWIQGMNDLEYYNSLNLELSNVVLISPNLESYDMLLEKGNLDYIGTRLHAGVRALQKNIRTLILAVDNRAIEIGKDVNLNVIKREDVSDVNSFINSNYTTNIKLPKKNIDAWKETLQRSFLEK